MQTDLTMTNHGFLGYMIVVSKLFWKNVTQILQRADQYDIDVIVMGSPGKGSA